ncbi:MAG: OB-fold domain-containing protein, partial [Pseudomonadales bacterium]|nr:OB-fold domain-containing protein [Pseudomonadales bacterium]
DEGVRMISWVIDCPPDQLLRGMPVEVVFQQIDEELTLPKFRRA